MASIKIKKTLDTTSSVSQNARDTKATMEDDAKESVLSNDGAKEISEEQQREKVEHEDAKGVQQKSLHDKKESDVEDEQCQSESSLEENTCDQAYDEDTEMRYVCPICDTILYTTHEFTLHIRSHNNDLPSSECASLASIGKGFLCRICGKILSSSSSLDRHVLVHTGERPFKCKICGFSFTTNGNMHRHMRTHTNTVKSDSYHNYESDASSDSCGSRKNISSPALSSNVKKRKVSRTDEFNNNIELSPKTIAYELSNKRKSVELDETQVTKRKLDVKNKNLTIPKYKCNICDRDDFVSLNVLETHLESNHPEHKAKCETCNIIFKNHRALNLHRFMIHFKDPELENHLFSSNSGGTVGFNDLTFVDFSSQKFPHIARVICEQSLHHASSIHQKFQCDKCKRAFPCASALKIHEQNCGNENYASSGESYHNDNDLSSSDNDLPTDLSSRNMRTFTKRNSSESSEDVNDEQKREHFFAGLDLRNIQSLSPFNSNDGPAHNDYNNKVCFSTNVEGKDLADIQSIISVTSTGGLLPDLSKSPQPTILEVTPPDSGSRNCVYDSAVTEEEQQDCFAADFRKMKLRGEFPCRLCTAVFPNLRALKGHNRVHLSTNTGGSNVPYRCNMCPHSSSDKSALIRHMRTHNGDRPYECGLCHYAFTTKANCERHLRNRHSKMSREEVKKSIIYHPSEDPTNDIEVKINRDDVKRSLFTEKDVAKENPPPDKQEINPDVKVIKPVFDNELQSTVEDSEQACNEFMPNKNSSNLNENDKEHNYRKSLDVGTMTFEEENYPGKNTINMDNKIVNVVGEKYNINTSETPLDLTMDVLDLSKKKSKEEPNTEAGYKDKRKQDLSSSKTFLEDTLKTSSPVCFGLDERQKILSSLPVPYSQDVNVLPPSHASVKNFDAKSGTPNMTPTHLGVPKLDLTSLYSVNTHLTNPFYISNSHGFSAFSSGSPYPPSPLPPYFIPPPPPPPPHLMFSRNPTQDFVDMKERLQKELIRGLQLTSGGSLVLDQFAMASAADRIQTLHQQALAEFSRRLETSKQEIKKMSPLIKSENRSLIETETNKKKQDKAPVTTTVLKSRQDSSSVKMVIKNGVLIPKQKQRRYRTERPFSCEHCSARFTLRSNMERHIKQQHPQFWTQRQRNSGSNSGTRRSALHTAKVTQSNVTSSDNEFYHHVNSSIYKRDSDVSALRPLTPKTEIKHENTDDVSNLSFENKSYISDEVKHAITQQLKSKLQTTDDKKLNEKNYDLEDENEELIIDEGTRDDEDVKKREERSKEESENINTNKNSAKDESVIDLASVSRLLDNASTQTFRQYFRSDDEHAVEEISEEDEEGLVASSASEGNNSGSDENRSETDTATGSSTQVTTKKKSAYSLAPNRVSCPYCYRKFPWSSSLRRHILTHTGQKPYKCSVCPLLFTTKSNCDRHLLRKHGGSANCAATAETSRCTGDNNSNETMQQNYTMRNVPERPYKCKFCPSSTFSTLSNLKKHIVSKHQQNSKASSGFESHGSGSDDIEPSDTIEREKQSKDSLEVEKENQSVSDEKEIYLSHSVDNLHSVKAASIPSVQSESTYPTSLTTDLPFKCHLCDGMSFSERQDALEHIKENHQREFELLVSKGALDTGGSNEDNPCPEDGGGEENLEQLRGKFPDYANRKVMCAFCLRRFWSAEDLRRHMRTHTGERPFSCDICRRRFTLKHSMLRHRKKHSFPSVPQEETSPTSDEETNNQSPSLCQVSNINNNNISSIKKVEKQRPEDETDLISNLLGIQDKSIVDKMLLSKSADDAAKLLGVHK